MCSGDAAAVHSAVADKIDRGDSDPFGAHAIIGVPPALIKCWAADGLYKSLSILL